MPPTTSTIIITGSPGSGKSEFIKLLAKPVNDNNTGNRKRINVSPFIEDDRIVRLVEFPSFSELGVNPTDAELLVDIAGFLEIQRRYQQAISGIIYLHRTADLGSQSPDADRNLNMLSRILGDDAMKNVVIATDGWGQIAGAAQPVLKGLFSFPSQFKRYDGAKLAALYIIHHVLKKTPETLRIQTELGADEDLASTTAGQELVEEVNDFIAAKQAEDRQIRRDIADARRAKDKDKVTTLDAQLAALGLVLDRLKAEQSKVEAPVNWAQAEADNTALDKAITERYELVTTDWKAKYDALLVQRNQSKDRKFDLSLRVKATWIPDAATISQHPGWLMPLTINEVLSAENEVKMATYDPCPEAPVYRARNSAGQVGWISTQDVTVIAVTS